MGYINKRKDYEQKHQEDLVRLRNFRLLDDDFMTKVFEDKACTELLLRIILERTDLSVQKVQTQCEIKNLQGRSVRLDIFAVDSKKTCYNIEVQRSDKGAGEKRARYNSSMMDANITESGEDYQNLAETYVIFITEHDVLKAGLPLYHIDRTIQETGTEFHDGSHIIYVNAQIKEATELGRLMHDFACIDADKMYYQTLADRVRYFKEDEEGVTSMCKAMEDMRTEAREEGMQAGEEKRAANVALRMLKSGKYTLEEIVEISGLPVEEIQKLQKKAEANEMEV